MKDIKVMWLAELMSQEDRSMKEYDTEVLELGSEQVSVLRQRRQDGGVVFDNQGESDKIGRHVLSAKSTMKCVIPSKDIVFTFFHSCKLSYCPRDLVDISFDSFYEGSRYDEEVGLEGYNIVDLQYHSKAKEAIDSGAETLRIFSRQGLREYVNEKHKDLTKSHFEKRKEPTQFYLLSDTSFDLCFKGYEEGSVADDEYGKYSVYETDEEICTYICQKVLPSGRIETKPALGPDEIIDFFGFDPLAKRLYKKLDYRTTKIVTTDAIEREAKRLKGLTEDCMKYYI